MSDADKLLREALRVIQNQADAVSYSNDADEVGHRVCCGVVSYKPHEKDCEVNEAITTITTHLSTWGWIPVPTEPGWYWLYDELDTGLNLVEVFKRPGHDYLAIAAEPTGSGKRDFHAVSAMTKVKWQGPIPIPERPNDEPKPKCQCLELHPDFCPVHAA